MAKSWSALVSKQRGRGRVTVRGVVKRTQRSWLAIVQPRTRVAPSIRSLPILSVFRLMLDEREAREGCRVERFHEFPSFSSPRETTGIERGRERWQERIAVEEQELDKITFVSLK